MEDNFNNNQTNHIHNNILIVGAGGIGCELIKSAVMNNFKSISIVDMDTIEKSNLNRQFLFDESCVGKFKSEMAKLKIQQLRKDPILKIKAFVGNIKDKKLFDDNFFKNFDLILNALDNIEARSYINQTSRRFNIPLINSGTEGKLANLDCYIKDKTNCYDCFPKLKKKNYPVCSIRSKPEKIEHCVIYAKALFELLFCNSNSMSYLEDIAIATNDCFNSENEFEKIFESEIETLKREQKELNPINIREALKSLNANEIDEIYKDFCKNIHKYDHVSEIDQLKSIIILINSAKSLQSKEKFIAFDKENNDTINFIYSVTVLRARNFNIDNNISRFKVKEIAGNIVPAIASTNAIIAALQIKEAIKLIKQETEYLRNITLTTDKITSTKSLAEESQINCQVCNQVTTNLFVNIDKFKVKELVSLCKKEFEIKFLQILQKSSLIYEEEDLMDADSMGDEESDDKTILEKYLKDFSNNENEFSFNVCDSEINNFKITLLIHNEIDMKEKNYRLEIADSYQKIKAKVISNNLAITQKQETDEEDDELKVMESGANNFMNNIVEDDICEVVDTKLLNKKRKAEIELNDINGDEIKEPKKRKEDKINN